jgi:hypothetical protein
MPLVGAAIRSRLAVSGWPSPPLLGHDKTHDHHFRVTGDLLARRYSVIQLRLTENPALHDDPLPKRRGKLDGQGLIRMGVSQGNHCRTNLYVLKTSTAQYAKGSLAGIEVPAPARECRKNGIFQAFPCGMGGVALPGRRIRLLDGNHPPGRVKASISYKSSASRPTGAKTKRTWVQSDDARGRLV